MKSQKEVLDILAVVVANEPSKWLEEADYRFENKAWLQKTQAIALKILRSLRSQGMSQKDLAEKLNVSPQMVNQWVKGSENFTLETISKIEHALGVELINVAEKTNDVIHLNDIPFKLEKTTFPINAYPQKENKLEIVKPFNQNNQNSYNQSLPKYNFG